MFSLLIFPTLTVVKCYTCNTGNLTKQDTFQTPGLKKIVFSNICFTCTVETEGVPDHDSLHYLLGLNLPFDHQEHAEGQESIKAKVNAIRNKLAHEVRKRHGLMKMIQTNIPSFHKREHLVLSDCGSRGITGIYIMSCLGVVLTVCL